MKLSYSNYRNYINCPRFYYNLVNKVKPPEKDSRYFALYGMLIEMFFKKYTNDYTKNGVELTPEQVKTVLKKQWAQVLQENYVNWNEPWVKETSEQIFDNVYNDVLKNMKAFDFWKDSRSEVSFRINLKKSKDALTCRMDFIWNKPDGTVEILDGKGTNKIDTNVDVEQLYFYALIYLLNHGKLPNKLGFLYYRYQMIKYVDFDLQTILQFKDKLALVKKSIKEDTVFKAKVGLSKQCKWCSYKFSCEAWAQKKEANAKKREARAKARGETVEIETNGGIADFSF